ncbi:MAG: hypothetical protein UV04_C0006G0032 [Candidatus Gottesmanbacteria bacterium GW2011_GWA2_42_16]|nr:MAG: hypothetical protein UV04_C0006G0032 [Candidatus Gottesmanbacteria bacterium GW2011_GWA2_42_16]
MPYNRRSPKIFKFGKINRWFTTHHRLTLPTFLVGLLLIVAFASFGLTNPLPPLLTQGLESLAYQPQDSKLHLQLGQMYFFARDLSKAQIETQLALVAHQDLVGSNQVLGDTTDIIDLQKQIATLPLAQKQAQEYWLQVVASHPDYRDAWVQLAFVC